MIILWVTHLQRPGSDTPAFPHIEPRPEGTGLLAVNTAEKRKVMRASKIQTRFVVNFNDTSVYISGILIRTE